MMMVAWLALVTLAGGAASAEARGFAHGGFGHRESGYGGFGDLPPAVFKITVQHGVSEGSVVDDSPRKGHHVRFWGLSIERVEEALDTAAFWLASSRPAAPERAMWVGAATKDVGLSLTRLSFKITQATDVDTNTEREFLVQVLIEHGGIGPARYHLPGQRLTFGMVDRYVSDGLVAVADLSQELASPIRLDGQVQEDFPVKFG